MITVSSEFQEALENGDRNYLVKVDITLTDSTVLSTITKDGLIELSIEDAVSQDTKFTALGGAVINKATITIDNSSENYSTYDFKGAIVTVKIGLQIENTQEYIDRGVYIVDSTSPQGIGLELSCLDYMSKFDKSYTESNLVYPATIQEVIQDACTVCGVTFIGTYPDSDYVLTITPAVSTFREVLSAIGQITGTYAHIDRQGKLYFSWFDKDALDVATNGENGDLLVNDNNTDYQLVFTQAGTIYRGVYTIYSKVDGVHYIDDIINNSYEKDNITIKGVRAYIINDESNEKFEYRYPTTLADDEFCLNLTGNPLIHGGNIIEIINRVGARVVGLTIRQTSCKHINNPLMEAGDVAMVLYAIKNNTNIYYPIVITRTTFAINQAQETVCGVETLSENLDGRYSDTQLLREQTKKDTNDAKKVATNYLSADTTGIMIADLVDGVQTPSTATGRNVKIDSNSVYIRNGQTTIAQFGDIVTIGKTDGSESYQRLDYHSLQMVDIGGNTYLHVSDLRGRGGLYEVTESYVITTTSTSTTNISVGMSIYELVSVLVDAVEYVNDCTISEDRYTITINHGFNENAQITIVYKTKSVFAKAYTFGFRTSGSVIGGLSFAEGNNNVASGFSSHAEGGNCIARSGYSHAEGFGTNARGLESHAEGNRTIASGDCSHAEGQNTIASGYASHAGGYNTIADYWYQTVIGAYNKTVPATYFIIGNGTSEDNRHNVFTVSSDGTVVIISRLLDTTINPPSTLTYGATLQFKDKVESRIGYIGSGREVDNNFLYIAAQTSMGSTYKSSGLKFSIDSSGNASVSLLGTGLADSFKSALGITISEWETNKIAAYKKQGNVVTVTWSGTNTDASVPANASYWLTLATIADGYRPSRNIYSVIRLGTVIGEMRITTQGNVTVKVPTAVNSGVNCAFNVSYVI